MEIVRGNTTFTGVKENEAGDICCEKCGARDNLKMTFHADYTDYYDSALLCECGNTIGTHTMRTEEEKLLWSGD